MDVARAVIGALDETDAVTESELEDVRSQLPADFDPLFARIDVVQRRDVRRGRRVREALWLLPVYRSQRDVEFTGECSFSDPYTRSGDRRRTETPESRTERGVRLLGKTTGTRYRPEGAGEIRFFSTNR